MAIRIYIDQGHNPDSPNAGAEGNGYREQDLVYEIGQQLYERVRANPAFEARLSRPTPESSLGISNANSLRIRTQEANSWGADLFLSLHTNASTDPAVSGSEALVYSLSSTAARIGEVLLRDMTALTGLRNRGLVERPGLYVLRRTAMPAVLMELGFISNAADADLMSRRPDLFAEGLYRGLVSYYGV